MVLPGDGSGLLRIISTIIKSSLQSGGFLFFLIKNSHKRFYKIVLT